MVYPKQTVEAAGEDVLERIGRVKQEHPAVGSMASGPIFRGTPLRFAGNRGVTARVLEARPAALTG